MGESIPKINEDLLTECPVLPSLEVGTKGEIILLINTIGIEYNSCKMKQKALSDAYKEIIDAQD